MPDKILLLDFDLTLSPIHSGGVGFAKKNGKLVHTKAGHENQPVTLTQPQLLHAVLTAAVKAGWTPVVASMHGAKGKKQDKSQHLIRPDSPQGILHNNNGLVEQGGAPAIQAILDQELPRNRNYLTNQAYIVAHMPVTNEGITDESLGKGSHRAEARKRLNSPDAQFLLVDDSQTNVNLFRKQGIGAIQVGDITSNPFTHLHQMATQTSGTPKRALVQQFAIAMSQQTTELGYTQKMLNKCPPETFMIQNTKNGLKLCRPNQKPVSVTKKNFNDIMNQAALGKAKEINAYRSDLAKSLSHKDLQENINKIANDASVFRDPKQIAYLQQNMQPGTFFVAIVKDRPVCMYKDSNGKLNQLSLNSTMSILQFYQWRRDYPDYFISNAPQPQNQQRAQLQSQQQPPQRQQVQQQQPQVQPQAQTQAQQPNAQRQQPQPQVQHHQPQAQQSGAQAQQQLMRQQMEASNKAIQDPGQEQYVHVDPQGIYGEDSVDQPQPTPLTQEQRAELSALSVPEADTNKNVRGNVFWTSENSDGSFSVTCRYDDGQKVYGTINSNESYQTVEAFIRKAQAVSLKSALLQQVQQTQQPQTHQQPQTEGRPQRQAPKATTNATSSAPPPTTGYNQFTSPVAAQSTPTNVQYQPVPPAAQVATPAVPNPPAVPPPAVQLPPPPPAHVASNTVTPSTAAAMTTANSSPPPPPPMPGVVAARAAALATAKAAATTPVTTPNNGATPATGLRTRPLPPAAPARTPAVLPTPAAQYGQLGLKDNQQKFVDNNLLKTEADKQVVIDYRNNYAYCTAADPNTNTPAMMHIQLQRQPLISMPLRNSDEFEAAYKYLRDNRATTVGYIRNQQAQENQAPNAQAIQQAANNLRKHLGQPQQAQSQPVAAPAPVTYSKLPTAQTANGAEGPAPTVLNQAQMQAAQAARLRQLADPAQPAAAATEQKRTPPVLPPRKPELK